jgi:hypothetical protein
MSNSEQRSYVQVAVFRSSDTGKRVAVSLMWVTTIHDTDIGTVFTFLDGSTQTVEESFDRMAERFMGSVPPEPKPKRRTR